MGLRWGDLMSVSGDEFWQIPRSLRVSPVLNGVGVPACIAHKRVVYKAAVVVPVFLRVPGAEGTNPLINAAQIKFPARESLVPLA